MPSYDYECKSCGYTFEVFQGMMDPPLESCPKCGEEVRRLIGAGLGVIFKGSGFYVTDNRKTTSGNGNGKGGENKSSDNNGNEKTEKKKPNTETAKAGKSKGN